MVPGVGVASEPDVGAHAPCSRNGRCIGVASLRDSGCRAFGLRLVYGAGAGIALIPISSIEGSILRCFAIVLQQGERKEQLWLLIGF